MNAKTILKLFYFLMKSPPYSQTFESDLLDGLQRLRLTLPSSLPKEKPSTVRLCRGDEACIPGKTKDPSVAETVAAQSHHSAGGCPHVAPPPTLLLWLISAGWRGHDERNQQAWKTGGWFLTAAHLDKTKTRFYLKRIITATYIKEMHAALHHRQCFACY